FAGDGQLDFLGSHPGQLGGQDITLSRVINIDRWILPDIPQGLEGIETVEQSPHLALQLTKWVPPPLPLRTVHGTALQTRIQGSGFPKSPESRARANLAEFSRKAPLTTT